MSERPDQLMKSDGGWPGVLDAALASRLSALSQMPQFRQLQRSFDVYYRDAAHLSAMDAMYRPLVHPGDLVFDIGSHVGDRISSFRRLGARVVALEPQSNCVDVLTTLYGDSEHVEIIANACGRQPGTLTLHVNPENPTVSTASRAFITAASGADGWREQVWDGTIDVPVTTLDALVGTYGAPVFAKIDVEGFEAEVLHGLSLPLPLLSFEFTTIQREVAMAAIEHLCSLGQYSFNAVLGESHRFVSSDWVGSAEIRGFVTELPQEANSGDIYARLERVA